MSTHLERIRAKVCTRRQLREQLDTWTDQRIIFTNGVFDLLHPGHIDYLSKAADLGDRLVIGVNSDASVRTLNKGTSRPIQDEASRAFLLASLSFVDAVSIFGEPTPYELIQLVQPEIVAKGGDYLPDQVVGKDIVEARGGRVAIIDLVPGFSTTAIEKRIREAQ